MTAVTIRGKKLDTAGLGEIRITVADLDLAALGTAALLELGRRFAVNARKFRRARFSVMKRSLLGGVEQIGSQLAAELERRRRSEPGPAAPLRVVFERVEVAGCFAAFVGGLAEVYVAERAKIAPQGDLEKSIIDLRSIAFECAEFCRATAAAICRTELPEVQSFQ